jgi:hypothetical protein
VHTRAKGGGKRTFIFKEVAHPRPPREHQLRHVLDDLGFVLRAQGGEPFRQSLREIASAYLAGWQTEWSATYHLALPRQEDEISAGTHENGGASI